MLHNIAGPLCFSGDVVKQGVLLPLVINSSCITGILIAVFEIVFEAAIFGICLEALWKPFRRPLETP